MLGAGVIIGWLLNSYIRYAGNRKKQSHRQTGIVNGSLNRHPDTGSATIKDEKEES